MQLVIKTRLLNQCLILSFAISGEILVNLETAMHWSGEKKLADHLITETCRTEPLKLLTSFNEICRMDLALKNRSFVHIAHQVRTSSTHQLGQPVEGIISVHSPVHSERWLEENPYGDSE